MKICIVSDLHLAASDSVDNFGVKKIPTFLKFLDYIVKDQKVDILVLAGDIEELWQGPSGILTRTKKIHERYNAIFDALVRLPIKVVQLLGNHDSYLGYKGFQALFTYTYNSTNLIVLHGHQFDKIETQTPALSRFLTELWGAVEFIVSPSVGSSLLQKIELFRESLRAKKYKSAATLSSDEEFRVEALNYAKKSNANIIVIGHTHKGQVYYDNPKKMIYTNSGSWVNSHSDYVIVDLDKQNVELNSFIK
jgi:UDP-2,3-diacylglucosamine pyrophosphatase LpxH